MSLESNMALDRSRSVDGVSSPTSPSSDSYTISWPCIWFISLWNGSTHFRLSKEFWSGTHHRNCHRLRNGLQHTLQTHVWVIPWSLGWPTVIHDMIPLMHAHISLGPSGNSQGLQKNFNIYTGKVLKRCKTNVVPMSDQVVRCMNA